MKVQHRITRYMTTECSAYHPRMTRSIRPYRVDVVIDASQKVRQIASMTVANAKFMR